MIAKRLRPTRPGAGAAAVDHRRGALGGNRDELSGTTWTALSVLVGVISGMAASAFASLVNLFGMILIQGVAGTRVATVASDTTGAHGSASSHHPWMVPLVVAGGAVISGLLVRRFTGSSNGGGTDGAIAATHENPQAMTVRATAAKMIGAAITIGSGGSSGTEGPAAQIGAGFTSALTRALGLTPGQARVLVTAGLGATVGAVFRAPLAGALLGPEMLYRRDLAGEAIIPSLMASAVSFAVFGSFHGGAPMFGITGGVNSVRTADLAGYVTLGLVCALLGRLYVACLHAASLRFARLPLPQPLSMGLAGCAVGLIGLAVPGVLGTGYGTLQGVLDPQTLRAMPWALIVMIPLAKILATSLTMGSGAAGGVFGPGMVIGGTAGAALWRVMEPIGLAPAFPSAFVTVGMVACLGSIARAPLAMLVLAMETTSDLSFLAIPMVVIAMATLVVGDVTLFKAQPATRAEPPAGREHSHRHRQPGCCR